MNRWAALYKPCLPSTESWFLSAACLPTSPSLTSNSPSVYSSLIDPCQTSLRSLTSQFRVCSYLPRLSFPTCLMEVPPLLFLSATKCRMLHAQTPAGLKKHLQPWELLLPIAQSLPRAPGPQGPLKQSSSISKEGGVRWEVGWEMFSCLLGPLFFASVTPLPPQHPTNVQKAAPWLES